MTPHNYISQAIRSRALELGFSACGFAPAESLGELAPVYDEWIASGRNGEMGYLARNRDVRLDPGRLVTNARTVISLAASYFHPLPDQPEGMPRISRYALGDDYHDVLKNKGRELLAWIDQLFGPASGRVFTDSAPLPEREWARRAGLGWIGRNGCLILPGKGSWFFLAEIIVDIEIPCETALVPDRCGTCTRCVEACPTHALEGNGSIDPRRCISYLTIEHRSAIPEEFRGMWKDWIFGCDICQNACPWNARPEPSPVPEFMPRPEITASLSDEGFPGDPEKFNLLFDGTPVERAGYEGILRNLAFLEKDVE